MIKRFTFFAALVMLCGMVLGTVTDSSAAGRLNFMLVNLSGQEISEVRICPTYYPNYVSENLLQTNLENNTKLYIGPNYYGDQKFWNIQLTWANGYTHTFTHNRLTRYNTYMAYVTPYGTPRLRQSYERAFARYDYGPNAYAYNSNVALGTPEKVNVAVADTGNKQVVAQLSSERASTRKTRDLVFEDDDDSAPTIAGSTAEKVTGETIAMKATVELTRDGNTTTVLPTEDFKSGDRVRLIFSANRDGHIYWLSKGTTGQYSVLFPSAKAGMDNTVVKNKEYTVPVKGGWKFDDNKGTETVVAVLSPHKVAELDKAVELSQAGQKAEASAIVENLVNGHETKRTTRDLVFEEEDEDDVNTKSQKANGDEPFVATYELTHN